MTRGGRFENLPSTRADDAADAMEHMRSIAMDHIRAFAGGLLVHAVARLLVLCEALGFEVSLAEDAPLRLRCRRGGEDPLAWLAARRAHSQRLGLHRLQDFEPLRAYRARRRCTRDMG